MAYQIETITAEHSFGMVFTFWGKVSLLKKDDRVFSKYIVKSNQPPVPQNGWTLDQFIFQSPAKLSIKKGQTIDSVKDELGNVYYEVTSII